MQLTDQQIETYRTEGYLFLPNVFSAAEVGALNREVPGIFAMDRKEIVREKDGKTARTAFVAPSPADRTRPAAARRRRLYPPVQDQRQGGVRRRRLAVASGLRHLGAGRPDAGAARA